MINFRKFCAVSLTLGFLASHAFADAPDERLITAPLVTPAAFSGSTTHSTGIGVWTQTPPEMLALARTLGSDRLLPGAPRPITADQYAENVFNYVRSNIAVELRYGLGKGARGALIDQSGTPFDQAELMVKLLRVPATNPALAPNFRYGTITLSAAQFGQWTGLVYNLTQATQVFTVDAASACQLLADGGIPATCTPASGNLTSVTLAHVWVGLNGKLYDPSMKEHLLKNAISLSSAMGCGTDASSTCGSAVANALTTASPGTFAGSSYYENLNIPNAKTTMATQYAAFESYVINNNRLGQVIDFVGGKVLAPAPIIPNDTLPYVAFNQTNPWTEIPDELRTKMTVMVPNCGFTAFADEIAGRRVSFTGGAGANDGGGADHLWIDGVDTACGTSTQPSGTYLSITIAVNHPYPATGGTYGDDSTLFNLVEAERYETGGYAYFEAQNGGFVTGGTQFDPSKPQSQKETQISGSFPVTIVHGFGDASSSAQQFMSQLQNVAPVLYNKGCRPASSVPVIQRTCGSDTQPLVAEAVGVYRTLADRIVAGITSTNITRHHDVGVVFASRTPGLSRISVHESASINARASTDTTGRGKAFEMSAIALAMAEGAAGSGDGLTGDDFSSFSMGMGWTGRWYDIAPANMSAFLAAMPTRPIYTMGSGFEGWRKTQLQSVANAGFSVIIADGGDSSLLYKTNSRAYTIWENLKGASAPVDPIAATMKSAEIANAASMRKQLWAVSPADGGLTFTADPDISTGASEFPFSLPFVRTFKPAGKDVEQQSSSHFVREGGTILSFSTTTMTKRGGVDTDSHARLGGGWTHNYNITATFSGNAAKALGEDFALEGAQSIASFVVLRDLLGNTTFKNRLASWMASRSLHGGLYSNTIVMKRGAASQAFFKSSDLMTYFASDGSSARMRTAAPINTVDYSGIVLEYTGVDGDKISFTSGFIPRILNTATAPTGSGPVFKADAWTFPNGMRVDFDYVLLPVANSSATVGGFCDFSGSCSLDNYISKGFVLQGVHNNLGRSLTIASVPYVDVNSHKTGYRITSVTDESNTRSATFDVNCSKVFCDNFTATDPTGKVTKYEYAPDAASPNPAVFLRPDYQLRRWFTPKNSGTPYVTFAFDELFRIKTVTDILGRSTKYLPGSVMGTERRKPTSIIAANGDETKQLYNEQNSLIWSTDLISPVDQTGRTTTYEYDNAGRQTRVTYPELNSVVSAYDIRGNLISTLQKAKPGSSIPDTLVSQTTYVEGPTEFNCATPARCNKPVTVRDATNSVVQTAQWSNIGQIESIQGPTVPLEVGSAAPFNRFCYSPVSGVSMYTGTVAKVNATTNRVKKFAYQSNLLLQSATVDPNVAGASLDLSCLATTSSTGANLVTTLTYDATGNLYSVDGPLPGASDITTFNFDYARRLTRVLAPLNSRTRYTYDDDGQVLKVRRARVASPTDANPNNAWPTDLVASQWQTTTNGFDAVGQLVSLTDDEANVTQYGYDLKGRKVLVTDPDLRQTATLYDAADQVSCIWRGGTGWTTGTLPSGCTYSPSAYAGVGPFRYVEFRYTGNGKQDWLLDANNGKTDYVYDGVDRPQFTLFNDGVSATSLCTAPANDAGNPTCTGSQTYEKYAYDSRNNKISLRTRAGVTIAFTYDALSRVDTKSPPSQGIVTNRYNLLGEPTSVQEVAAAPYAAHSIVYAYDTAGRKTSETNDGRQVSYLYNEAGKRTRTTWPDGYYVKYDYDELGRMTHAKENGSIELAYYNYDTLSRRNYLCLGGQSASCISGGGTNKTSYTYEPDNNLDVLTQVLNGTTVSLNYGHNMSGQINGIVANDDFYLPKPTAAAAPLYTPNTLNQYTAYSGQAVTNDLNGNLLTWFDFGGKQTYTYDSENRLVTAAVNGATTPSISYDYDGLGRRYSKTVSDVTTTYLLDGDEEIAEYSAAGTLLRRYVMGPAVDDRIAAVESSGTRTYFHLNHQGSVIAMTDATGNATGCAAGTNCQKMSYDEYGRLGDGSVTTGQPYRYTGRRFDPETGIYFYRARYYAPTLGRFLQTDPIGYKDDFNLYAYVGNDPLNKTDPTGTEGVVPTCIDTDKCGTNPVRALKTGFNAFASVMNTPIGPEVTVMAPSSSIPGGVGPSGVTYKDQLTVGDAVGVASLVVPALTAARLATAGPAIAARGLANSALVARGGNAANQSAARINAVIGPSRTPGVSGFSAQCNGGTCLSELGKFIPNKQFGVTTVGEIRAIGGDVIATPGIGNHVTVTGVTGEAVSPLFRIFPNPNPLVVP